MSGLTQLKQFQKPFLMGLVDETEKNASNVFSAKYFTNENVYTNDFFYQLIKNTPALAPVIQFGAEKPIIQPNEVAKLSASLVKIGLKHIVGEMDLLAIHHARFGEEKEGTVNRILQDANSLVEGIRNRYEAMRMEALSTGKIVYQEGGVDFSIDFQVPATSKAAPNWAANTVDVIGDLLTYVQAYKDANDGMAPTEMLVATPVINKWLRNTLLIAEAGRPDGSTRLSRAELNAVFADFGLPPIREVDQRKMTYRDIFDGTVKSKTLFGDNQVVLVKEGIGKFVQGICVESDYQPRIALSAYDKDEPIQSIISAAAVALPVLTNPEGVFIVTATLA